MVFDEISNEDAVYIPLTIREQWDSCGWSITTLQIHEKALSFRNTFSMFDDNRPFCFFKFWRIKSDDCHVLVIVLESIEEIVLKEYRHMLFLIRVKGYITSNLFAYIMKELIKLWTTILPGPDWYLISDYISIHESNAVTAITLRNDIHMFNITLGILHWLEVHDQEHFATSKKSIEAQILELTRDFSPVLAGRRVSLVRHFYKAAFIAFNSRVLWTSFGEAGLWQWSPQTTVEKNEKHFLPYKEDDVNDWIINTITVCI